MRWKLELSEDATKWLRKADRGRARRILKALRAVSVLDDPRDRGKALTGSLDGLWRYRVGDYRVICDIRDQELVIVAVEIGKRDSIYD
ncbi:type II toxin-antitoxin system RelE family toxin [Gulosibacter molinativorax]|uniref:Type II toxin-antitoxin system RelE/ParE family toxin n=1 Tax=Gulosibacter molinativorax TaxID=256821 RepID=A0ABT7C3X3_9MICO|nr:type II toxin-antitoxin system RelE/ParE family toxin [Gulosibacter molinativorax]MDJ1369934.1 type II toxin-antitoxin system RelE/ParE family toxin [Gulosibacter molinativorax]QUY61905.1 Toxin RelG [Gulosibacter molinativorax]